MKKEELSQALHSHKNFGITLKGEIKFSPFSTDDFFVYQGIATTQTRALKTQAFFGNKYKVIEQTDKLVLTLQDSKEEIINYNIEHAHFAEIDTKGISDFKDEKIEDMAWMLIEFDLSYEEIFEFLEQHTEITLICLDAKDSNDFCALGYFDDLAQAQEVFYNFAQEHIQHKLLHDPDFTYDYLDEEQREAVAFFKAK